MSTCWDLEERMCSFLLWSSRELLLFQNGQAALGSWSPAVSMACPGVVSVLVPFLQMGASQQNSDVQTVAGNTEGLPLHSRLLPRASHALNPLRQGMLLTQLTDGTTKD